MKFKSVFDIIGPVMVGPSSSHTAGAARIGLLARNLFGGQPDKVDIYLYGSFRDTYQGHATDVALLGAFSAMIPTTKELSMLNKKLKTTT